MGESVALLCPSPELSEHKLIASAMVRHMTDPEEDRFELLILMEDCTLSLFGSTRVDLLLRARILPSTGYPSSRSVAKGVACLSSVVGDCVRVDRDTAISTAIWGWCADTRFLHAGYSYPPGRFDSPKVTNRKWLLLF